MAEAARRRLNQSRNCVVESSVRLLKESWLSPTSLGSRPTHFGQVRLRRVAPFLSSSSSSMWRSYRLRADVRRVCLFGVAHGSGRRCQPTRAMTPNTSTPTLVLGSLAGLGNEELLCSPHLRRSSARVQDHLGLARWLWPIGADLRSRGGNPCGAPLDERARCA